MAVKTELEILDVRHFSGRQLRPLLEHEARVWQHRLRWNYDEATELLLQYLDSRVLPGFVALDRGKICGFTFCVYEGYKAVVGDAYALDNSIMTAMETTHELLRQLLSVLEHSPDIDRIESQLLLYDTGRINEPFRAANFQTHRRLFMEVDLIPLRGIPPGSLTKPQLPNFLELRNWAPGDYQPAAELIHAAYVGHVDATINDQYRSLQGSQRFLHNIVRFPGCGVFDAKSSWVLRDLRDNSVLGIVLSSRVRQDTAHITQLCVRKDWRGRKFGQLLIRHTMLELAQRGCAAITLTVTEANRRAVDLYRECGFNTRHAFDAHVHNSSRLRDTIPAPTLDDPPSHFLRR